MNAEKQVRELIEDLRACHEYYCRYHCATMTGGREHTLRCDKLRGVYGFPMYPGGKDPQDVS